MNNHLFIKTFYCLLVLLIISSCSSEKKDKAEMNTLEKKQQEIAQEIVSRIKTPINKAENAKKLMDKHANELEKNLNNN